MQIVDFEFLLTVSFKYNLKSAPDNYRAKIKK